MQELEYKFRLEKIRIATYREKGEEEWKGSKIKQYSFVVKNMNMDNLKRSKFNMQFFQLISLWTWEII